MKNFFFVLLSLLSFNLFAEIPFYLQDWIIPNDFTFGTLERIPEIPGTSISQTQDNSQPLTAVDVLDYNSSKVNVPTWFAERNLFDWGSSYEETVKKLNQYDEFIVNENIEVWKKNNTNGNETIEYNKRLSVQTTETADFCLYIFFPKKNDYKLSKLSIRYYENRTTTFFSNKKFFEKYYAENWNKLSDLERKIICLTAPISFKDGFISSTFDFSDQTKKTVNDAYIILHDFNVTTREDLINLLNNFDNENLNIKYSQLLSYLIEYPDLEPFEIAEKENFSLLQTCRLVFANQMKDKLGKQGIAAYDDIRKLYLIQLGVFYGFFTKQEGLNLCEPIVNLVLNNYNSYEDYFAHYIAGACFNGVKNGSYILRTINILSTVLQIKNTTLPSFNFDSSNADKEHIMTLDDSWFEPTEYYYPLFNAKKAQYNGFSLRNIDTLTKAINLYGELSFLTMYNEKIYPVRYDQSSDGTPENFYKSIYKDVWKNLPEIEKYGVAFSSALMSGNNDYVLDFKCSINFENEEYHGAKLLKDSWEVTNHDELIKSFNSLEEYGHSGAYASLEKLLNKYPDKTPLEIAQIEGLSILQIGRLYFVEKMRDTLGSHGIEAWDEGRAITILRWGINAGYITYDEAISLSTPVINRILNDYTSWEDYMAHYISGRNFFGIQTLNYEKLNSQVLNAVNKAMIYIPTKEIQFIADNADTEHIMNFTNCGYIPTDEGKKWEIIGAILNKSVSRNEFIEMMKEFPDQPCLIVTLIRSYSNDHDYESAVKVIENNFTNIDNLPHNHELYINFHYQYLYCLNNLYQPKKCIEHYETLDRELQENLYVYYQHAYANYLLANISEEIEEHTIYQSRAIKELTTLKRKGFKIGQLLENWIETVKVY